jgi:hypothetical protein
LYEYSRGKLAVQNSGTTAYGLQDLHEFISEAMTNPEFQADLRVLRYKAAPFSLWDAFSRAIAQLFRMDLKSKDSDVMVEVMRATNILIPGEASLEGIVGAKETTETKGQPKAIAGRIAAVPAGMQNTPSTLKQLTKSRTWGEAQEPYSQLVVSAKAASRPALLGALTLRQIGDLVRNRVPQVNNFIRLTEEFLARKNNILKESGDILNVWSACSLPTPRSPERLLR